MYVYDICNKTDRALFKKSSEKLKKIQEMKYIKTIEDVDSSLIGEFICRNGNVFIKNDEEVGALYIESEKDIEDLIFE
ncbi:MAG: hypothetical protein ACTTHM_02210 [Peptoanaerobacter stomatis]|uniref:hypothetical protein n=1 Tax=Peptoanaerobacter stomatis TaxID=796937 RepID=UPI003F9ED3C0